MKITRQEVVRKFRNAFIVLACIFLAVIVGSAVKIINDGGEFWSEFSHELFVYPGLSLPFGVLLVLSIIFIRRDKQFYK